MMSNEGVLLYLLVRGLRADKIVETGVVSGASTYYILAGIKNNEIGHLYSIYLPIKEEDLRKDHLKKNWY